MKTIQNLYLFISFTIFYFIGNISKVNSFRAKQDDDKKLNLKELAKENMRMNRTLNHLKDILRGLKERVKNYTDENDNLKVVIAQKRDELDQLRKNKTGSLDSANRTRFNYDEDNSGLLNVRMLKDIIDKFSDFQVFNQHIQNEFLREKDFKDSLEIKLKDLYKSETKVDNIYNNIQNLFTGRLTELSSKISSLERSHFDIEQRLKNIDIDKTREHNKRSKIRLGLLKPNHNKLIENSEYLLFNLPNCNSLKKCNECMTEKSCVWCSLEKKCVPGGINGPTDGSCMLSYIYGNCPDSVCDAFNDCKKTCIENEECGWCGSRSKCFRGNKFGPNDILCDSKNYYHINNPKKCRSK